MIEAVIVGVGLWIAHRRRSPDDPWRVDAPRLKETLRELGPLLITSSSALIYTRLDQAMVGWLSVAGLFAIASSMAEAPRFALLALFISVARGCSSSSTPTPSATGPSCWPSPAYWSCSATCSPSDWCSSWRR